MINRLSMKVSTRIVAVFVFGLLIVPAIALAQWREPDQAPPQGNVPRPLNQGTQFIGEASSTSFVSGVYANQGANGAIVLKVEACPNGQTYVANGGKWSCGTAGGGNQNLLQVLTNGSDASTFTGSTYIGGAVGINVASTAALPSKLQVQGDAGSLAAIIGASQTGSGAIIGANLPSLKAGIYAAGAAGEWSGYFYGGNGVYIEQKLGIGTTAPTAQLDVRAAAGNRAAYLEGDVFINSKIQFPNRATTPNDGGNYILTTNQNADLMVMAQNNLYLIIDEQPAIAGGDLIVTKDDSSIPGLFIIKNNGNVGIGTVTPDRKLDITAPATAQIALNSTPASGTGSWDGIVIQQNNVEKWYTGVNGDNASADYVIRRNRSANDLTIQNSSGNVGIGIATPESLLSVGKSAPGTRGGEISIANTASPSIGNEAALNLSVGNTVSNNNYGGDAGDAQIKARSMASNNATDLIFSTYNGSSFGERMRIQSGGRVGIGTATPSPFYKLTVQGGNGIYVDGGTSSVGVRVSLSTTTSAGPASVLSDLGYTDQQNIYAVHGHTTINGKDVTGNLGYYDLATNRSYGVYGKVGTNNVAQYNYGGYFEGEIGVEILSTDFYALHAKNSKFSTVEAYLAKDLAAGSAGVIGNAIGSNGSIGVAGNTDIGRGVYGIATGAGGRAVEGNAASATGLAGYFAGGLGVRIGITNDATRDYIQLDAASSAPPASDCDDSKRGRMVVDYSANNRLYICNGTARGWDYVALTN